MVKGLVLVTLFISAIAWAVVHPVIDNAGFGCEDGYCVWMQARYFSKSSTVEVRTSNDGAVLNTYASNELAISSDGVAFGFKSVAEKNEFLHNGVKVYLINNSLRSNGYFVKWGVITPPPTRPTPVIDNAGYGCEDGYCIWIAHHDTQDSVSVELRTADDKTVVATYTDPERTYSADGITLGLATQREKDLFATTGLMVHLKDFGLVSNGLLVKRGAATVNPNPTPTPTPTPVQRELYYSYFGVSANSHLETADHTNLVFTASWGDWNSVQGRKDLTNMAIQQMLESKARGVKSAIVTVDYLVFNNKFQYKGTTELREAFQMFKQAGVLDMIVALYPVDEPDDRKLNNQTVTQINNEIRAVMAEFSEMKNTKLAVFYTDHGNWPGLASYDWVGYDSYGSGPQKPPISGNQKIMTIPGGSNPWKENPERFYNDAMNDPRVVAVIPFVWFDGENPGIRSNGMASSYRSVGCKITGRCAP